MKEHVMQAAQYALQGFLQAFSQFRVDEMMVWWVEDATAFFPVEHQRERLNGKIAIHSGFEQLIRHVRAEGKTQLVIVAEDLQEQESGDMSVITFHLRGDPLCRRTFVLRRVNDQWRIVHLHASNAPLTLTDR